MNLQDVMEKLEELGTEQTKKTFLRHGAKEPLFGVKIGDLKKLTKFVKKDQELVRELYRTGNSDAMYLAGLTINPKHVTKEELEDWMNRANWHAITEYTVANVAAESPFAIELALEWIDSDDEIVAAGGWSTYTNYISITPDEELNINEIKQLLKKIEDTISKEKNRVRYVMNGFVIGVGSFVKNLNQEAIDTAKAIGKVTVHMGDTACKVPLATEYIEKVADKGKIGVKRKTCIC
ncbi:MULTISPECIES: DNA alkylation repair protein [Bacillus]|uniref:DNA alkylation repair protein n=1 Tax=Bacillus TaxID=1386 RepID=UPI00037BDDD8|nr:MULTISPECIES: DNA alkylation repair protein [Bacillus]